MREFKSFYKTVSGNEGNKCFYPTRLDTYGCGCYHDCKYCYAKSLLEFRNFWNPNNPSIADIQKIERKIKTIKKGSVVRLGGMTDCFQPCEIKNKVTYQTIQLLNKYGIHYLIVTKSNMVASDEYINILDKNLAHIQITVTSTDDSKALTYERATLSSLRIQAIEKLSNQGFDVALRVSPFIPEFIDFNILKQIQCNKVVVEFLRVNSFIKRIFDIDYAKYTHTENGYNHLPLSEKIRLIKHFSNFEQITVCEDCTDAYDYWKTNVNYNTHDCCNLKLNPTSKNCIGNPELLKMKKLAFLSSRKCESEDIKKVNEWAINFTQEDVCIISGFQSRLEKEVLNILLKRSDTKIVLVLATRIYQWCPVKFKKAIDEGRMLIISPFKIDSTIPTLHNATKRNKYVINNADEVLVGTLSKDGMLDKLTKETQYTIIGSRK